MTPRAIRLIKLILGWAFMALGIVGIILPVMPGVIFLFVGLVILAKEQHWAHQLMLRIRRRFPHLGQIIDDAHAKADRWLERLHR